MADSYIMSFLLCFGSISGSSILASPGDFRYDVSRVIKEDSAHSVYFGVPHLTCLICMLPKCAKKGTVGYEHYRCSVLTRPWPCGIPARKTEMAHLKPIWMQRQATCQTDFRVGTLE